MDQIILCTGAVEIEVDAEDAFKSLSDLELAMIGGGIGDTILK
jgi:hypothetical protein